jgi:predicted small metal-binding protein
MLEVSCGQLGLACSGTVQGDSKEQLAAKVAEHARDAHDVELNQTLIDYALSEAREVSS